RGDEPADPIPHVLGEPQGVVRAQGDALGLSAGGDALAELSDHTGGGDPADLVGAAFGEVQVVVRPGRDVERGGAQGRVELGDDPGGGDPADLVRAELGEPQVAVGSGRDVRGVADGRGDGELGGHGPGGG